MDNEQSAHMQVDPSTTTLSAIQAFKADPSTKWVVKSVPGFLTIKYKMGCPICDTSVSHCMTTKRAYKIHLNKKDISNTVADTWPELARYQDNYYCLLEDQKALKEALNDIPASDGEDDNEDLTNLLIQPEEIPQDILLWPHLKPTCPTSNKVKNVPKVIPKAGIPAIGCSPLLLKTQKRIIADPPASITGVLPKTLSKVQAEHWDQPALRGGT
ncbi:hypothetical protein M422DRAFT_247153 [Sphaerobolus stellatus SS14]|nr:hypothetical protein M422DRAFT_247153 [Sphaerobolus stellatus SS14]